MGNIVRWFEDFPRRALDLLPVMKAVATERDRIGSLSLLIAPALIVAPYERLRPLSLDDMICYFQQFEPDSIELSRFQIAKLKFCL